MKTLTFLLLTAFVLGASGYLIKVPTTPVIQPSNAPIGWVHLQRLLLPLFENVCEESRNPIIVQKSQEFKQDVSNDDYQKSTVLSNLQNLKGLLPKGEIFTEYNVAHLNELKVIYELFYYANDFNTFYKAACWARQNVNCGLFVDALYAAIIHRKDTEKISIPAPYEVLPNYFIRKDFIISASSLIAGNDVASCNYIRNDGNAYILDVNYTQNVYDNTAESNLVYFYEDIGLNSYYYLLRLKILPWVNNKLEGKYGEHLYHQMKQLMARYNLERYSNGLDEIEGINWDYLNILPYNPMLVYSDGIDFSQRTTVQLQGNEKLTFLKTIEDNIATVVTHMREGGFNKSEVLNHLMEILFTNGKSYENVALQLLNEDTFINNRPPSVLGHYMTSLRDPAFWALNKKIVDIVDTALKALPGYARNELYFPGVEVLNVDVKKMMTTVDNFVFDVTDALEMSENYTNFKVKISQPRLNHKQFSIKVNVTSLVAQKGLMKIYLGPKVKPGGHAFKKNLFMLLDMFEINLKIGNSIVTRTSMDIINNSDDFMSLYTIRKKLADAEFGLNSFILKSINEQIAFPSRLVIPRGLAEGLPLQIFVFVVPFGRAIGSNMMNTEINRNIIFSPGFPLDLAIEVSELFELPNAYLKDIVVIHKDIDQPPNYGEKSGPKSWQSYASETPSERVVLQSGKRPEFTMKKEPYDYNYKKAQYGKQEDYAANRGNYNKNNNTHVVDKTFKTSDDKYVIKPDVSSEKITTYTPVAEITNNEEKFAYKITTDGSDQENIHFLSKKFQDTHINMSNVDIARVSILDDEYKPLKDVHIDVSKDEKTGEDTSSDAFEYLNKKDNMKTRYEKIVPKKMIEESDISTIIMPVKLPHSGFQQRSPTIYDIVFNPFDDIFSSDEKVFE